MKKTNRRGFTTVELVIVIAVIAILAAVMIPTFSNLIEKAENSAITQETRAAITILLSEKNGTIPTNTYIIYVDDGEPKWFKYDHTSGKLSKELDETVTKDLGYDANDEVYTKTGTSSVFKSGDQPVSNEKYALPDLSEHVEIFIDITDAAS